MTASDTILDLANTTEEGLVRSPEWYRRLVEAVNDLVLHDFNGLVQILYRLDVSESKIRQALSGNPGTDAAELIAQLLLKRQLQKLEARKYFSSQPPGDQEREW